MKKYFSIWLLVGLVGCLPATATGIAEITIDGNEVRAEIELPGDIGADLTLRFEQVVGLSVANLGLSADLVSLTDPSLLSRLPSGVSIPAGFPVLITIEPPATGGLSFSGLVTLAIHTHELAFTAGCPLRFFAAPLGGSFTDFTAGMGTGSYRARGARGSFSEFLILADTRQIDPVIRAKFARLGSLLDTYESQIATTVFDDLTDLFVDARQAYRGGNLRAAVGYLEDFNDAVEQNSGSSIPDVWRSARDLDNVAGELRSEAETLQFSLRLKASSTL